MATKQKALTIEFLRLYRKEGGAVRFIYAVDGTEDALAAYKEAQGKFYAEDKETGKPLFWSTREIGDKGVLMVNSTGRYVADTTMATRLASLTKEYGYQVACSMLNIKPNNASVSAPQNTHEADPKENEEGEHEDEQEEPEFVAPAPKAGAKPAAAKK
jgi:hypothetical protein